MAPRKQVISGTTSKGKAKATTRGTTYKPIDNLLLAEGTTSISSWEPTASSQPSPLQEDQLFQMLREMKEQMKEQLQLDREQEELNQLNQ